MLLEIYVNGILPLIVFTCTKILELVQIVHMIVGSGTQVSFLILISMSTIFVCSIMIQFQISNDSICGMDSVVDT